MATRTWAPRAPLVKQYHDTAGEDNTSTTYTRLRATVGGQVITGALAVDWENAIDNLITEIAAANHPYFDAINWIRYEYTSGTLKSLIQVIATTGGVPFTASLERYAPGTGLWTSFAWATTIAADGPNFWNNTKNWVEGVVPVDYDDLIFANTAQSCCWGWSSLIIAGDVTIDSSFEGALGLNPYAFATSADGLTVNTTISEYRTVYPQFKTDADIIIGRGLGNGSGRINIYHAGVVGTITVYQTATRARDINRAAVNIWRVNTSLVHATIYDSVGGVDFVENTELDYLTLRPTNPRSWVRAAMGYNVTNYGSILEIGSLGDLGLEHYGGTTKTVGSAKVDFIYIRGGEVKLNNVVLSGDDVTGIYFYGGILNLLERTDVAQIDTVSFEDSTKDYEIKSPFRGCFKPGQIYVGGRIDWNFAA